MILALESRIQERVCGISMAKGSLWGQVYVRGMLPFIVNAQKDHCVKSGFCWRLQDVGDTGDLWDLPRRTSPKNYVAIDKAEKGWRSEESCHSRHRIQNVELTLLMLWSCFGPLICYYVPFLPFGILTCILCHCILEVCDYNLLIDFVFRGDYKRFPWISEESLNSRFLNILRLW